MVINKLLLPKSVCDFYLLGFGNDEEFLLLCKYLARKVIFCLMISIIYLMLYRICHVVSKRENKLFECYQTVGWIGKYCNF